MNLKRPNFTNSFSKQGNPVFLFTKAIDNDESGDYYCYFCKGKQLTVFEKVNANLSTFCRFLFF